MEINKYISSKRSKYFAGIIICIILLYIFNNLLCLYIPAGSDIFKAFLSSSYTRINIPFLADSFTSCLWSINLAIGLGIMGNFLLLFYHPGWFYYYLQSLLIVIGLIPVYQVYNIFPFILNSSLAHSLIKNVLIGLMVIIAAVFIILFVKGSGIVLRSIRNFEPL